MKSAELSVIEELMPAGTAEVRHRHHRARQFFFVIGGALVIETDLGRHLVPAGTGFEIAPLANHEVRNEGLVPVSFLVVSQPASHGDREQVDADR